MSTTDPRYIVVVRNRGWYVRNDLSGSLRGPFASVAVAAEVADDLNEHVGAA